jgi:hypothetical protein
MARWIRGVAASIVAIALTRGTAARGADDTATATMPGPIAIYTRMTLAMRSEVAPPPLSYREVFEPRGLTLSVTKRSRAAHRIALFFTTQAHPNTLAITESDADGITISDETTKQTYAGSSLFTSITWAGIRHARGITAAAASPSPSPSPEARTDAVGPSALFDGARSSLRSDVVAISDKSYQIAFVARELLGDEFVYHLHLTPRSDPANHAIRDLYIDTTTFLVRRVKMEFKDEAYVSGYRGSLSLDFERIGRYWLVSGGTVVSTAHLFLKQFRGEATFVVRDVAFSATGEP